MRAQPPTFMPVRSLLRTVLVPILAAIALICGPLAAVPAQAADVEISGTVTEVLDAVELENVSVTAYQLDGEEGWIGVFGAETAEDGTYSLLVSPNTTYRLRFSDGDVHQTEYFDNVTTSIEDGTDVVVGALDVTDKDAELVLNQTISGTVTDSGDDPLENVSVTAFIDGTEFTRGGDATTGEDGTYSVLVAPNTTYQLQFRDDFNNVYRTEYYDDQAEIETAEDVVVAAVDVTDKDAELALNPGISGTVTNADGDPLENISVSAYSYGDDWEPMSETSTVANGTYFLPVDPGTTYRLRFQDFSSPTVYATEYYNDIATWFDEGDDVEVDEADVTDKDAILDLQMGEGNPTISGTPKVGQTLTANPNAGSWTPASDVAFTYQWYRMVSDDFWAPVGTSATYAPVAADVGSRMIVEVTGSKAGYASTQGYSDTTAVVVAADPPPVVVPPQFGASFSGNIKGGKKKATVSVKVRFSNVKTKKVKGSVYVYEGARLVKKGSFKKGKGKFKVKAAKGIHTYTVTFLGGANYGTKTFTKTVRVK